MENSRDSSVWRSLAVAFGDGLAFGVGMTLTQKAGRRGSLPQSETGTLSERLAELELRLAEVERATGRPDAKVLQAIVHALEERLEERDAQWAACLAGSVESLTGAMRLEGDEKTAAVRQENAELVKVLRQDVVEDLRTLENQAISFQQEIAEAMARAVDERLAASLETRLREIEARLLDELGQSAARARAAAAEAADSAVARKLTTWQELIEARGSEIAALRQSLAASDARTRDLLLAIGEACRAAAGQMAPPPPGDAGQAAAAPEESAPSAVPIPEEPRETPPLFSVEPARVWPIPLISTLVIAGGCLACLHWL